MLCGTVAPRRLGGQGLGARSRASTRRHPTGWSPSTPTPAPTRGCRRRSWPGPSPIDSTCSPSEVASNVRRPGSRWLHPAMLTTLVYRFGPPGARADATRPHDGQRSVHGAVPRDLPRRRRNGRRCAPRSSRTSRSPAHLADRRHRSRFLDASELLTVRMFESFGDAWRGWGRSLALPGVEPLRRQLVDLAVVVLAQVLPHPTADRCVAATSSTLGLAAAAPRHPRRHPPRLRTYRRSRTGRARSPIPSPRRRSPGASFAGAARPGGAAATPDGVAARRSATAAIANRRPMNVISTPVAAVRYGPSTTSCTIGNATKPTRAATANDRRIANVTSSSPMVTRNGIVAKHGRAAGEREDAAPSAEPSEHGERVADHRRTTADVGETPDARVGERGPDERSGDTLRAVADEHRDRRPAAERLAGVPEARVAVADLAQVDPGTAGRHQIGDRDRSDQVADHDRDCHLDAHR